MKKNKILSLVICAAGLALCAWWVPPAGGQTPPGLINFQGRLTDAANNPLSGAQDFVFEIYDSLSGGGRLWIETQNGIPVANGVLAAQLGAAVPVPASVFSSPSAYLQITVGGVTLAPRQRLVTAPYAFNSYSLQGRGYDAFVSTDAAAQSIAGTKTFTGVLASAQLRLSGGVVISSEALSSLGGGVRVSSNVYIVGFSSAAKYYGDGSALTGISVPGDGLGSHTAAQDLNMAGRQILNVASMTITGKDAGSGYSLYLSSGINMAGGTVNAGLFVGSGAGLSGVLASSVAAGGVRPGSLAPGAVSGSAQIADSVVTLAKFGQSGCAANQVPKWNGAAWACAADLGSAYLADEASLHLSGGAFSALPSSVTLQGNFFNGASQLLRLTPGGALPALNGAALLSVSSVAVNSVRDEAIVSVSGSKVAGNISGAAGSVANGVYTTGAYGDPAWIVSLATGKINLSTVTAALDLKADASAVAAALAGKLSNAATVPPGLIDLSTVTAALAGKLDTGAQAASVANGVYTTGAYGDPAWITRLATGKVDLSTVTAALDLKADASALAGKLSNTATVPPGLIDLSTVTAALAAGVPNGVYTTGSYNDPAWITRLATGKIDLSTVTTALDLKADASALAGKLSNTATVPPGLIDLSTVTAALAAGVPNGVYTTGSYNDPAWITRLATGKIDLSTVTTALNGKLDTGAQAASVANGVYTTGAYNDPAWITRLATGKIDLSTVTTALNGKLDTGAQAASVANGVYATGAYNDPSWITRLATGKIDLSTVTTALNGKLDTGAQAASVANGVYTTGSYADPSWLTSLSAAKLSGNISGNAASAAKLNSQGVYSAASPGTTRGASGLNLYEVYSNGYPTTYGNLLHMAGAGGGQLLVGWSGTDGAHADNYIRSKRDNDSGAWSPWAKLLTDVNYNSTVPSLTGAGASGTWGINVTGSAGSAATAANATYSTYNGFQSHTNDWAADFNTVPAANRGWAEESAGGPQGTWWFMDNMRHSNGSNYWGTQIAWGWEDNANQLWQRNVTAGSWSGWVKYLNSGNYNSYAPTLTGTGASGTWGINVTGSAGNADTVDSLHASAFFQYPGWVVSPGYDADTIAGSRSGFTYSNNAPWTGPMAHLDAGGYGMQFNASYSGGGDGLSFRTRNGDAGTWNGWNTIIHSDNIGSQSVNYAASAGSVSNADTVDSLHSTAFLRAGTNSPAGNSELAQSANSSAYSSAAIELRELNFAGAQTGAIGEAPRIGFHWGGRVASQIVMPTDGSIQVRNDPGTGYETFKAGNIYSNDNLVAYTGGSNASGTWPISVSGNAATATSLSGNSGKTGRESRLYRSDGENSYNYYIRHTWTGNSNGWRITASNDVSDEQAYIHRVSVDQADSAGAASGRGSAVAYDYPVSGLMRWKNYGVGHVIIDASASTSPEGSAINNTNAQIAWSGSYPTLMGWNGTNTYGVRVDSARVADNVSGLTGTWWGVNYFGSNKGGGSYVGGQNTYGLEAYSSDGGAAGMSFHRGGAYAVNMGLDPDNVLRIGGWSAPANLWQLDMAGNQTLAGTSYAADFQYGSTRRIKKDIADNNYGIKEIMRLQAKNYKLIADKSGKPQIGFIAEEVEKVIPELVSHDADGLVRGMDYGRLSVVLIEAMKDQQGEIEKLKAENAAIKLRLTALENK